LTNRLFFSGASAVDSPDALDESWFDEAPFDLARSFFFCLLDRFLAVFASTMASRSFFFLSNSATSAS
jgi:hypothetical protein